VHELSDLINLKFTFKKVAHTDNSTSILASDRSRKKVVITDDTQKAYSKSEFKACVKG
jgi:hypothetical protein